MNLQERLIPIKQIGLFHPQTLYNWRSAGKHSELFVKIGGRVFVDMKKLMEIIDKKQEGEQE